MTLCFHISFYTPLPLMQLTTEYDIDPDYTDVQITTQLPGGFNSAVLTARQSGSRTYYPQFPRNEDIRPRGHCTIYVGEFLVFRGTVTKTMEKGGRIIQITVTGYGIAGLNDDYYKNNEVNVSSSVSQIQTTQKTAGQLIADAINSCAPLIKLGSKDEFKDPGTIMVPGAFYGQTPAQIIEAVTKVGSSLNIVWDMWVYEDGILNLRPRALPVGTDPQYQIPYDDMVTLTRDYNQITGQTRVEYTLPEWDTLDKGLLTPDHNGTFQTGDQTNPEFVKRYGIMKRSYLKGGQLTAAIAEQFASTYLIDHFTPDRTGIIDRDEYRGLESAAGGEVPGYMVQSGQWVGIGDEDPLIIVRTKLTTTTFQCEVGKSAQHWEAMMSYLNEISRHVVMSTNPLSGLRA